MIICRKIHIPCTDLEFSGTLKSLCFAWFWQPEEHQIRLRLINLFFFKWRIPVNLVSSDLPPQVGVFPRNWRLRPRSLGDRQHDLLHLVRFFSCAFLPSPSTSTISLFWQTCPSAIPKYEFSVSRGSLN